MPQIITMTPEGIVTGWGPRAADGDRPDAAGLVGRSIAAGSVPDVHPSVIAHTIETLGAGEPWEGEVEMPSADGSTTVIEVQGIPVLGADGTVTSVVLLSRPVEGSPRVALARTRSRLELALDVARVTTWEWDTRTGELQWGANHADVLGTAFPDDRAPLDALLDLVHADDRAALDQAFREALDGAPFERSFRARGTGGTRWLLTRGRRLGRSPALRTTVLGVLADLTESREKEQMLARTLETMTDAFLTVDRGFVFRYINARAERLLGMSSEQLVGRSMWDVYPDSSDNPASAAVRRAAESDEPVETVMQNPRTMHWLEVRVFPDDETISIYFRDVTHRVRAEQAAAWSLAASTLQARLGEAFDRIAGLDSLLDNVAEVVLPLLGDVCVLEVLDGDQQRVVAATAVGDEPAEQLRLVPRRAPGGFDVHTAGRRTLALDGFDDVWARIAVDDLHRGALEGLGVGAGIAVPVVVRGETLGVLSLGWTGGRVHDDGERALAEDVARRTGLAIETVRQVAARAAATRSLQARLLPLTLPAVPGVEVAARYVAAGELDVGGDFYDLFEVDGGAWIASVGDVSGKGPEAAAMTGLLRHTLRAVAAFDTSPERILAHLNRALLGESGVEQFCTVVVAAVRPTGSGFDVSLASGGHPLPAVVRADGSADIVGRHGGLVGAFEAIETPVTTAHIGPGEAFVLYTDGVIERRVGSRLLGEDGLREALGAVATSGADADALADAVARAVTGFDRMPPVDDMAVMVLRAVA